MNLSTVGVSDLEVVRKTISGGYRFNFKGAPEDRLIELGLPAKVLIPLEDGCGREVQPLVTEGDKVKAGQIVGRSQEPSNPVHASVSGRVESLTRLAYLHGGTNALVIKADGATDWQPLAGHAPEWQRLSQDQIKGLLFASGVIAHDGEGIPTGFNTSSVSSQEVEALIIQGVEDTPYHPSLSVLIAGARCEHFIEGLAILNKVLPRANIALAINNRRQDLLKTLVLKLKHFKGLKLYSLAPKYPQSNEWVLARTILGGSAKKLIRSKKVVVLSVATVLLVRDAVVEGKPLIERIVALGGPGWKENYHIRVRVGTPLEDIASRYLRPMQSRLIPNNLLTNEAITDLSFPVDRNLASLAAIPETTKRQIFPFLRLGTDDRSYSRAFISAFNPFMAKSCDTNINGEARPCIFCGYCEEICPADIIPHLFDKHVERNLINKGLIDHGIFDCVECNLCTYICPSKISLAESIKLGKQKLVELGFVRQQD